MSIELLEAFGAAWNAHDVEALLSMVTDDCVFETAAGAEVFGNKFIGKVALREAFPIAWKTWPDAQWADAVHYLSGDRGVSEWTFIGTDRNGKRTEVRGVDQFELRDGLIARQDTYRKVRRS